MIDYIKARFKNKDVMQNILVSDEKFELKAKYDLKENIIDYPFWCEFENFKINVSRHIISIENSIHKHHNMLRGKGLQNADNFSFNELKSALNRLEITLGYDLDNTILNNLEFGFNIDVGIDPSIFLEKHLLMYKYKSPCYDPKNDKSMKIKKFTYQEYEIKIYNKSLESINYAKSNSILRVEVKYKTKKQFNKLGIFNLNDLKKSNCINNLYDDYISKLSNLLIVDSFNGCYGMKRKEQNKFSLCTNPSFWDDTRRNFCDTTYQNRKDDFEGLIEKHKQNKWRNTFFSLLEKKYKDLFQYEPNYLSTSIS